MTVTCITFIATSGPIRSRVPFSSFDTTLSLPGQQLQDKRLQREDLCGSTRSPIRRLTERVPSLFHSEDGLSLFSCKRPLAGVMRFQRNEGKRFQGSRVTRRPCWTTKWSNVRGVYPEPPYPIESLICSHSVHIQVSTLEIRNSAGGGAWC